MSAEHPLADASGEAGAIGAGVPASTAICTTVVGVAEGEGAGLADESPLPHPAVDTIKKPEKNA